MSSNLTAPTNLYTSLIALRARGTRLASSSSQCVDVAIAFCLATMRPDGLPTALTPSLGQPRLAYVISVAPYTLQRHK